MGDLQLLLVDQWVRGEFTDLVDVSGVNRRQTFLLNQLV